MTIIQNFSEDLQLVSFPNMTYSPPPPLLPPLLLYSYAPITLLASLGCLLVISAILTTPALRNLGNLLLLNLGVSDLLLVTVACPVTLSRVGRSWIETVAQLTTFVYLYTNYAEALTGHPYFGTLFKQVW